MRTMTTKIKSVPRRTSQEIRKTQALPPRTSSTSNSYAELEKSSCKFGKVEKVSKTRGTFPFAHLNTIQEHEDYLASQEDIRLAHTLARKHWLYIAELVKTHHEEMMDQPELIEDPDGINIALQYLLKVSDSKNGRVSTAHCKLGVSQELTPENANRGCNVPMDVSKTLIMMILSYMPSAAAVHSEETGHSTMDQEPCIMMQKIFVCNSSDPTVLAEVNALAADFDQSGPVWRNEMGADGQSRQKQIPAAERWRRKDPFVRMGNILTLGYWMECILAAVNKKRLQMGLPMLANCGHQCSCESDDLSPEFRLAGGPGTERAAQHWKTPAWETREGLLHYCAQQGDQIPRHWRGSPLWHRLGQSRL